MSEGPYATLNLGRKLGDDPERVDENRRRLCDAIGTDVERIAMNYQVHSASVTRGEAGERGVQRADALWTDERRTPVLALGADCSLVALVRTKSTPAVAVVHAGRIGVLDGVLEAAVDALGGRPAAIVGPTIGPCCYEVGEEVAAPFRARFGSQIMSGRNLDLPAAVERSLRDAGCISVERLDLCTSCNPDLFYSYRRDGKPRGGHGVIAFVA